MRALSRRGSAERRWGDPVLRHRRPDHEVRPGDRQDDGFPRPERPGQRPDLRPQGRLIAAEGATPAAIVGSRSPSRRHREDPCRRVSGQAVQQPQRCDRRRQGARLCQRPPLRRQRAPRTRLRGRLPDRPRRHRHLARDHRQEAERPGHLARRQDPLRRRQRRPPPGAIALDLDSSRAAFPIRA